MRDSARTELENLRAALDEMKTVPAGARRFHEIRDNLARRVASELEGTWLIFKKRAAVEELAKDVQDHGILAAELRVLFARAERASQSAERLRTELADGGDAEIVAWIDQQLSGSRGGFARMGERTERRHDVAREAEAIDAIEKRLRDTRQAVEALREAQRIEGKLGLEVAVAPLRADLPELRRRLLTEGPTEAWLTTMEARLQPLRDIAPPPPREMPRGLRRAGDAIRQAERWATVLDLERGPIAQVAEKIELTRHAEQSWTQAVAEALFGEAEQQLAQAREIAALQMKRRRAELEEDVRLFREACGDEPELERRLTALAQTRVDDVYAFEEWQRRGVEVQKYFESIAATKSQVLASWIEGAKPQLADRLDKLRAGSLALEVRDRTAQLAAGLTRLGGARDLELESGLRALRELARARVALANLEEQARADLHDLDARRASIGAQHDRLQAEARRGAVTARDLGPRIAQLNAGAERQSIEERRRNAAALEGELEAIGREILRACQERAAHERARAEAADAALRDAGHPPSQAPTASAAGAGGADLPSAVAAVHAAGRRRDASEARVASVLAKLDARADEIHGRLRAVPIDGVGADEKEAVEDLLDRLAQRGRAAGDATARLRELHALVEEAELRLDDFAHEEREVDKRRRAAEARLREIAARGLKPYAREAYERAAALLEGLPAGRRWGPIKDQLKEVERILARVLEHGMRLAAAEVEEAVHVLEERQKAKDPEVSRDARAVLTMLAKHGHHELPPPVLRTRALNLAGLMGKDDADG